MGAALNMFGYASTLLLLCCVLNVCYTKRVLLLPVGIGSHIACFERVGEELQHLGHEVHMLLPDSSKDLIKGTHILSDLNFEMLPYTGSGADFELLLNEFVTMSIADHGQIRKFYSKITAFTVNEGVHFLQSENLMQTAKEKNYDIAVVDSLFFSRWLYLLPHRIGIPFVSLIDVVDPAIVPVPWLPSFVPHFLTSFTSKMTFWERLQNVAMNAALVVFPIMPPLPETLLQRYQQYGAFDSLDELVGRSKLWLVTSDVTLDYAKPLMSSMIEVGGLTTRSSRPLPAELLSFVDGADHGVIIISFGSMAKQLPDDITIKILDACEKLDQRVIWRYENNRNFSVPENVQLLRWLPQNDVLGHENVKLFITHCGNNGQFEALYHATPMIGFPLFSDQPYNCKRMEVKGFGICMDIKSFSAHDLVTNIQKIIGDGIYEENISRASRIFRGRQEHPGQRAARWIEHVMLFGGDHLRSYSSEMPWYQYMMLDILGLLLVMISVIIYFIGKLLQIVGRLVYGRTDNLKVKKV